MQLERGEPIRCHVARIGYSADRWQVHLLLDGFCYERLTSASYSLAAAPVTRAKTVRLAPRRTCRQTRSPARLHRAQWAATWAQRQTAEPTRVRYRLLA